MSILARRNTLISQRVEVALVYRNMLGVEEARAYLERENVPEAVAARILEEGYTRNYVVTPAVPAPGPGARFEFCRRHNPLHDAIVEAALKIECKLGRDWALALLQNEGVPADVAARILAQGPRQLRCKNGVAP